MSSPVSNTLIYGKQSDGSGGAVGVTAATQATGTLTLASNALATETVTIGARVYTWAASANTQTPNVVKIGATASDSLDNLILAVNGGTSAQQGSLYSFNTVQNAQASAAAGAGDTMVVTARASAQGADGNAIPTTETMAGGSWGAATLAGGVNGALLVSTGTGIIVTTTPVTEHPVALGASASQIVPIGAISWAALLLTGTGTINSVAMPLGIPLAGGTLGATVTVATGSTSSAFVLYETAT